MVNSSRRRASLVAFLTLSAASLSGCATTPPARVGPVNEAPAPGYGQESYTVNTPVDYPLHANDIISVSVFREPDLSSEKLLVGADGTISMPLVGQIKADGLTPKELQDKVQNALAAGYLKRPEVAVNVVQYASHVVTVEGGVQKPGVYAFPPGSRLSSAVALASGLKEVAKVKEVAVFRNTPQGMMVAKFDYGAVSDGSMMDPLLMPGDRVVVGISGLSQLWQDLIKALPAFALFTRL